MAYYLDNGLGKDGANWDAYGKDIFDGGVNLFTAWITSKYGSQTAQTVESDPNSAYANQLYQLYLAQLQSQQNQNQNNALMYVGIGLAAAVVLYMLMDNGKRR